MLNMPLLQLQDALLATFLQYFHVTMSAIPVPQGLVLEEQPVPLQVALQIVCLALQLLAVVPFGSVDLSGGLVLQSPRTQLELFLRRLPLFVYARLELGCHALLQASLFVVDVHLRSAQFLLVKHLQARDLWTQGLRCALFVFCSFTAQELYTESKLR
jgi:hypothetical protein